MVVTMGWHSSNSLLVFFGTSFGCLDGQVPELLAFFAKCTTEVPLFSLVPFYEHLTPLRRERNTLLAKVRLLMEGGEAHTHL